MDSGRLSEIASGFGKTTVVVVGDFFLDKYLDFDPELAEVSIETGKPANQVVGVRCSAGAAGTVANNLVALGAGTVVPVGFTGDDGEGYELRKCLTDLGCSTDLLHTLPELRTPTYLKPQNTRIPGLAGEAERYDTKNREPLPEAVQHQIIQSLETALASADAVIIADQVEEPECGVITSAMRGALSKTARARPAVVFFADSRRRIGLFRDVIIKPNQSEAVAAVLGPDASVTDEHVIDAGTALYSRTSRPVFVTRSEKGIIVFDDGGHSEIRGVAVVGDTDPTGAGDSATAAAVLTLASGGSTSEAALMANLVASIVVQQIGVTGTASTDQLAGQLELWTSQGR